MKPNPQVWPSTTIDVQRGGGLSSLTREFCNAPEICNWVISVRVSTKKTERRKLLPPALKIATCALLPI